MCVTAILRISQNVRNCNNSPVMRVLLYSFFALKIIFQNVFLESILTALLSRTSFNPWGLQKYTSRGSKYFFFLLGGKKKRQVFTRKSKKQQSTPRNNKEQTILGSFLFTHHSLSFHLMVKDASRGYWNFNKGSWNTKWDSWHTKWDLYHEFWAFVPLNFNKIFKLYKQLL